MRNQRKAANITVAMYCNVVTVTSAIGLYTLNTGILFENGDSILELLRWVFHYEITTAFILKENRKYISDKKQITYILTQNVIAIPVHFKFFRVYACVLLNQQGQHPLLRY